MTARRRAAGLALLLLAAVPGAGAAADLSQEVRAQLSPSRSTILSAEIPGKIGELTVREGDRFQDGQRLVAIDCALHKARLDKAMAQLQAARKAQQVNARLDKLGSISTLEVEASVAQLAAAEAEVAMMRTLVERCVIPAPFAGRVVELKVKRHQFIGEGHELLEILDDRELEVELIVPSLWLRWLTTGSAFTLHVEETGRDYPAKVTRLAARIDPVSQSIKVFGTVTGTFPELMSGMSGTARFTPPS